MTSGTRHSPHDGRLLAGTEISALAAQVRLKVLACGDGLPELGELRAVWSTTNTRFLRFACLQGDDVVVKLPLSGDSTVVSRELRSLQTLHGLMSGSDVAVPLPVGRLHVPAALLTAWIPGSDLDRQLRLSGSTERVSQHVAACGRALAHFHGHSAAWVTANADSVLSAEDFAPNNVRVSDAGQLWWLDPPTSNRYVQREDDVSHFLTLMCRMMFRDHGSDRKAGRRADVSPSITAELVAQFLAAYQRRAAVSIDEERLRSSVKVRLRKLARKDFRRGHPVRAFRTGVYLTGIRFGTGTVARAHDPQRALDWASETEL